MIAVCLLHLAFDKSFHKLLMITFINIMMHGSELDKFERTAAFTNPFLNKKDRASRVEPDKNGNKNRGDRYKGD
jgi:hypothetical protein